MEAGRDSPHLLFKMKSPQAPFRHSYLLPNSQIRELISRPASARNIRLFGRSHFTEWSKISGNIVGAAFLFH